MKNHISDRTAWQRMLKNEIDKSVDLYKLKEELVSFISPDFQSFILENEKIEYINYPSIAFPEKIKSLNLLKVNHIEGILIAIKGQYLLFDNNTVINIRKHTGFKIQLTL